MPPIWAPTHWAFSGLTRFVGMEINRRSPRRTDLSSRMMDMPSPSRTGDGPSGGCWSLPESDGISSNTRFSPRRYKHVYVFQQDEHASFGARTWCLDKSGSTKEIILRFPLKTFLQMFLLNPFNQFCHHIQGWNTNVQSPEFITSTIRVCKGCWGLPQTGGTRSGNSCWNFTRAWCPNNILWIRFMLVSATGFVNGPAGFAIFLLWHGPSVRSCARQLEVVPVS